MNRVAPSHVHGVSAQNNGQDYPYAYEVFGVHDDKVYRALRQQDSVTDASVSRSAVGPKSDREAAPELWPAIAENCKPDAALSKLVFGERALQPARYF